MASKLSSPIALLLLILLFFTMVSSTYVPCPLPPPKPHKPTPSRQPPLLPKCPMDTLKLGVCANLLDGLVHVVIGSPPKSPCCILIQGLVDLEAAVCLCTAVKSRALGLQIDLSVSLGLLLNYCGNQILSFPFLVSSSIFHLNVVFK
ncbi:14 kDa proline-rich protein DC2.15-like [Cucurbita maxima]|uniref:14 kDa proline-rich protein DC2.15-like n=1 Tax=Cucurbita maxima TaxID=3661 RepID=A0A6J1I9P0_CUCMA|nr:14 kDa proline-rich protein DC2.15-like [Cucurbita maxima]